MLNDLLYRLRALIHPRKMDAEVDDELRYHLEREAEKHRRAGFTPNEAVRRAHLALGGSEQVKQQSRDARGTKFVEAFVGCEPVLGDEANDDAACAPHFGISSRGSRRAASGVFVRSSVRAGW